MRTIEVGYVARVHGLFGEVRVGLHWAGSDAIQPGRRLLLRRGEEMLQAEVLAVRAGGKQPLVKLRGLNDRNAAELWKGAAVFVDRQELSQLQDGEYYLADLVGAKVVGPDGPVGTVREIAIHPSLDSLVIQTEDGARLEQPLLDQFLERVDVEAGLVVLSNTDGLI